MKLSVKRVYDPASPGDGFRVLVDRLWPRGLSKEKAEVDLWIKHIAPTDALRKWFGHDPERWDEFKKRYAAELDANAEAVDELREQIGKRHATLLFGAKDEEHNNAVMLAEYLTAHAPKPA